MRTCAHLGVLALFVGLTNPVGAAPVDCAMVGGEVEVTTSNDAFSPSLVWTGSEYGLAWSDERFGRYNRQIYFARLDSAGAMIGSEVRVTNHDEDTGSLSLVWTGSEFGLAWTDWRHGVSNHEIYFARLDSSGAKIGFDVRITNAGGGVGNSANSSSLVWTGSEYGVAWQWRMDYGDYETYFVRIDAAGNKLGGDLLISEDDGEHDWHPSLAWSGSEYGLAYASGAADTVLFTRISALGSEIGDEVPVSDSAGSPTYPFLIWTGSEYGVAFQASRDVPRYEVWVTRLNTTGAVIGVEREILTDIASSAGAKLAWSGVEFGLSWTDYGGAREIVRFTNLDSTMGEISDSVRLTYPPEGAGSSSLVWSNGEYGIAWQDVGEWSWPEGPDDDIHFARIVCGCLAGADPDTDGIGMPCDNCPAVANPDQSDVDRDGLGDACDPCTDLDGDGFGDPGYPANQCDTDNCPAIPNPDQTDVDQDSYGLVCECNDDEPTVYPGHAEHNDGLDNDCDDLVDEGSAELSFCCDGGSPEDCTVQLCWPAQPGATTYQVLRAGDRELLSDCEWEFVSVPEWAAPGVPDAGQADYYLHRPTAPLEGSWGPQSRSPYERDPLCVP